MFIAIVIYFLRPMNSSFPLLTFNLSSGKEKILDTFSFPATCKSTLISGFIQYVILAYIAVMINHLKISLVLNAICYPLHDLGGMFWKYLQLSSRSDSPRRTYQPSETLVEFELRCQTPCPCQDWLERHQREASGK